MIEKPLKTEVWAPTFRCQSLVIGSGAGGSVAAWELARGGRDVLVVEEGPHLETARLRGPVGGLTRELYRLGGVTPILGRPTIGFAEARCVGGGTVINGGLVWRTPDWILEEWVRDRGLSGYGPQSLREHFDTIEEKLGVVDTHAVDNRDSVLMEAAARSLGWKVVPARRALKGCQHFNRCPTGCPAGAKGSMPLNYLGDAVGRGARLVTGLRVQRIERRGGRISAVWAVGPLGSTRIEADEFFFAGGAVQTPYLLKRAGLHPQAGRALRFHLNLKIVARFDEPIHAERGTIFTRQVQEFERQGLYFMASNTTPAYVAATLSHLGARKVEQIVGEFPHYGLFVAQVRSRGSARVWSALSSPWVTGKLAWEDSGALGFALLKLGTLLFEAGARELYLPLRGAKPIHSPGELSACVQSLDTRALDLISVHAMASCPMDGRGRGVVDTEGRIEGVANGWICDASLLPDNVGESPQGTIMAFAHEVMKRRLAA